MEEVSNIYADKFGSIPVFQYTQDTLETEPYNSRTQTKSFILVLIVPIDVGTTSFAPKNPSSKHCIFDRIIHMA